jgi:putative tricarboxylic transport membrane protein
MPWLDPAPWLRSGRQLLRLLAVPGSLVLYILLADGLGFILTGWLLLMGLLTLFRGGRVLSSAALAIVVTLAVNYAFTRWLLVPLPAGLLQPVLY